MPYFQIILFLVESVEKQLKKVFSEFIITGSQESPGIAASRLQKEKLKAIGHQAAPHKKERDTISPEGLTKSSEVQAAEERLTSLCTF